MSILSRRPQSKVFDHVCKGIKANMYCQSLSSTEDTLDSRCSPPGHPIRSVVHDAVIDN